MEQLHLQVIMWSVSNALSEGAWKLFGYSSRPKYGSIIQSFRPKWKVDIERKLLRELIISHIAAHIVAGIISIEDVKQVIDAFVDYQYEIHDLVSLGYTSQKEAKTGMQTSIQKYAKTPVNSWDQILALRNNLWVKIMGIAFGDADLCFSNTPQPKPDF